MHVLVAGAGPAGSVAARLCADLDLDTVLVEGHDEVGRPVRCAGLVSPRALETCGLPLDGDYVSRRIRGAHVHGPSGRVIEMDGGNTRALVVERDRMDAALAKAAVDAGAELRTGTTARLQGGEVYLNDERVEPEVVIDASGARALAAGEHGLGPEKVLPAVQTTLEGAETLSDDFVEVLTGNRWAPGFFAWAVPVNDGARVGLATGGPGNPWRLLEKLLREHPAGGRLSGEPVSREPGPIPIGPPERTVAGNVLLVGDSAAQAKPTSGGGVYTGSVAARAAAEAAHGFVFRGDSLDRYEDLWRREIGRDLRFGMAVHRTMCRSTDGDIERLLSIVERSMQLVRRYGDIDHPSRLALALAKRPWIALPLAALYLKTRLNPLRRRYPG
ncbi:MAG: Digeranylgeranylglycerophospholipid reductase [Methanonatronarchaeales archaeon]|nr:Digeranylgeranylglycerophospholipid reductase [Methanonatronarchaeales archaeon]